MIYIGHRRLSMTEYINRKQSAHACISLSLPTRRTTGPIVYIYYAARMLQYRIEILL